MDGTGEAAELEQLLLTGLDGSKPVHEKKKGERQQDGTERSRGGLEVVMRRERLQKMKNKDEERWRGKEGEKRIHVKSHLCFQCRVMHSYDFS